jgi:hypothetical protein
MQVPWLLLLVVLLLLLLVPLLVLGLLVVLLLTLLPWQRPLPLPLERKTSGCLKQCLGPSY